MNTFLQKSLCFAEFKRHESISGPAQGCHFAMDIPNHMLNLVGVLGVGLQVYRSCDHPSSTLHTLTGAVPDVPSEFKAHSRSQ